MMTDSRLPLNTPHKDDSLLIFGWITTILGLPENADPSKYNELTEKILELRDAAVVAYRDQISGSASGPLSAPPQIIKQPVPCRRCGATEYADWTLYPHQLYNKYMPGGIGHYCFDCFAAIVSNLDEAVQKTDRLARLDEWYGINTSRDDMCEGIKTDRGGQSHASATTDYITGKERIAVLQANKEVKL